MGKKSGGAALRRLFDATPSPVYAVDSRRRIIYANPAFTEWTGFTADDLAEFRCDFHSETIEDNAHQAAIALCPRPEALNGGDCQTRIVIQTPSGHSERTAKCVALAPPDSVIAAPPQRDIGVLVFVEPEDTPAVLENPREEGETLHAMLANQRREQRRYYSLDRLLGVSPPIRRVRRQVELAITSTTNVSIIGPPGSGREHIARTIYYGGQGESGLLVPLSCELLDPELLESTLNAVSQQAQELDDARHGALMLLDVDRLSPPCQQTLGEWLIDGQSPLRTLSSSRRSLLHLARDSEFRSDLAFALSTLEVSVPHLSGRREDIPLLAQAFLEETNKYGGSQRSEFTAEAMDRLVGHTYGENVDELRTVVQQACAFAKTHEIGISDLPPQVAWAMDQDAHPRRVLDAIQLDDFMAEIERELIQRAMSAAKGNRTKAARLLGVSRAKLLRRLADLGLEDEND